MVEALGVSCLPRKWKTAKRNLRPGDIVMVRYTAKYTKPSWRLATVTKVFPDEEGIVRTAEVGARPRSKADASKPYKSLPLELMVVPAQRVAVLLAVESQKEIPAAQQTYHACTEMTISGFPVNHDREDDDDNNPAPADAGNMDPPPPPEDSPSEPIALDEASRLAVNLNRVEMPYSCMECLCKRILTLQTE